MNTISSRSPWLSDVFERSNRAAGSSPKPMQNGHLKHVAVATTKSDKSTERQR
jgi:hypothetical protein